MAQVRRQPLHQAGDAGHRSPPPPSLRVVEMLRRRSAELPPLTRRERECLEWCAEGKSYWETAVILGISERTVSFHMEAMRAKLGAGSNAHAVAMALRGGVLDPGSGTSHDPRGGVAVTAAPCHLRPMPGLGHMHRFCVAPMMEWTDRHCRMFHRQLTRRAMLYTEMVTAAAIIHGDSERLIGFDPAEAPVGLQLGGSDPAALARAARMAECFGYDEINLNCGCPSDRVQSGRFGACLMAEPELVARCFAAMQDAVAVPVTVKCRIGIDDQDPEVALDRFVAEVAGAGCRTFIVHARKAWLKGLSPKENRDVPPLDYRRVHRLKTDRPDLEVIVNGGIGSLDEAEAHVERAVGVMLGRTAYQDPWMLADVDRRMFGAANPVASRSDAIEAYLPYVERELRGGVPLAAMTRHVLGLFNGLPGARAFRRHLSEQAHRPGAGAEVLARAIAHVSEDRLVAAA